MSNEHPDHVNELTVSFKVDAENNVNWRVDADDSVTRTIGLSMEDLARAGAPLSVLGIRALYEILCDGMLTLALQKGNLYQCKEYIREINEYCPDEVDGIEGTMDGDIAEGVVIH